MDHFRIRPIGESDIAELVEAAGGSRAHRDADRRTEPGADFLLGDAVIELKELNDEGLEKPERQEKLAALFQQYEPDRPVIVLDRGRLPMAARPTFDRILEGPIKSAVAKARTQLKQSRSEIAGANSSILFVVNNGYTALNHEDLTRMVAHRVRNDTAEIDGIVVGGCYFYSDGFDSFFVWPLDYVPIKLDRPFSAFDGLKAAWDDFSEKSMTELIVTGAGPNATKGPVVDSQFDLGDVTYVKPTPPIGAQSEFFQSGRPRNDSSGLAKCPPVAITFPQMSRREWGRFSLALPDTDDLFPSYEDWYSESVAASAVGSSLRPFVPIPVARDGWVRWCGERGLPLSMESVRHYANDIFDGKIRTIVAAARERTPASILPHRYVLAATEEIGQDRANDVSHIALVRERPHRPAAIQPVVEDARIFHEHALTLACAYAVAQGLESVLWQKDLTYGWT